jgi:hypothetical protein
MLQSCFALTLSTITQQGPCTDHAAALRPLAVQLYVALHNYGYTNYNISGKMVRAASCEKESQKKFSAFL